MMTRDVTSSGYVAGCAGAPPPLHVTDQHPGANWFPVGRPVLAPTHPGPVMVLIGTPAPFGDDPTDPANQSEPRLQCAGMIGRLNHRNSANVGPGGVRL